MERRLMIVSRKHGFVINFHNNDMDKAETFRKKDSRFKHCNIKGIIQALPDKIECGVVYPIL